LREKARRLVNNLNSKGQKSIPRFFVIKKRSPGSFPGLDWGDHADTPVLASSLSVDRGIIEGSGILSSSGIMRLVGL
jgi:hypothetical protein